MNLESLLIATVTNFVPSQLAVKFQYSPYENVFSRLAPGGLFLTVQPKNRDSNGYKAARPVTRTKLLREWIPSKACASGVGASSDVSQQRSFCELLRHYSRMSVTSWTDRLPIRPRELRDFGVFDAKQLISHTTRSARWRRKTVIDKRISITMSIVTP